MSALSDLFQDIADAIRIKTGDTAAMAPASFPDNILAIETGGSAGEGSASPVVIAQGSFSGVAGTTTITHNLGVVPDFAMIWWAGLGSIPTDIKALLMAYNFSEAFYDAHEGIFGGYQVYNPSNGAYVGMSNSKPITDSEDTTHSSCYFSSATATTMKVGSSSYNMDSTKTYQWLVIGGLT